MSYLCLVCIFLGGSIKLLLCGDKLHMAGENAYNVAERADCDTHLQFCSQIHSFPFLCSPGIGVLQTTSLGLLLSTAL